MPEAQRLIINNLDIWSSAVQIKSATGRGKAKKIELYGIKKLRKIILGLAVRGLLVPQDPNEKPASELLKKIAAEKAQLLKDGKIKKSKALSPIAGREKPFEISQGWEWVRLGSLMEMFNGRAFKKSEWSDSGLPIVRIQNLNDKRAPFNFFDGELAEHHKIDTGTFLISWSGTPGTSFGAFIWDRGPGALNQHINKCLIFGSNSNYEYLRLAVNSCMDHLIANAQGGVGLKHVTKGTLNNIVFGLPPLEEQARIVAKVDELTALCDHLEQQQETSIAAHQTLVQTLLAALTTANEHDGFTTAWARIADHFDTLFTTEWSIDQLKQTILQLAVMGKLVPQDPNDEPASELLKKIAAEKAQLVTDGKIKKQKALPPIEEDEKPFKLPVGWVWAHFGALAAEIHYGHTASARPESEGIRLLRITDIQNDKVDWQTVPGCEITKEKASKYLLQNDDILIARTGGTIGKSYLVADIGVQAVFASYLIRVKRIPGTYSPYTKTFLGSELYWGQLHDSASGTGQPNVNATALKKLLVPAPPANEQVRIVAKVDELMAVCDTLKSRINTAQTTQLQLADSMAEQIAA